MLGNKLHQVLDRTFDSCDAADRRDFARFKPLLMSAIIN